MTAPGALPTREAITGLIVQAFRPYLSVYDPSDDDYRDTADLAWDAAEQILARLRPAWEAMEQSHATFQRRIDVLENDYKTSADEYRKLWKENDALRADLRACAEALMKIVRGVAWDDLDYEHIRQIAEVALARPGVQEALRSESKATAP